MPNTKAIEEAIQIRHDIVHRNGKDKDGNIHSISRIDVENLSNHVLDIIYEVDNKVYQIIRNNKVSETS